MQNNIVPISAVKLSPHLMHIENLSLSSLARSVRGVGAGDLREALEGGGGLSTARLATLSTSTLDHAIPYSGDRALSLQRTISRGEHGKPLRRETTSPREIKDILSKLGVGKESDKSLLKASFPMMKKVHVEP